MPPEMTQQPTKVPPSPSLSPEETLSVAHTGESMVFPRTSTIPPEDFPQCCENRMRRYLFKPSVLVFLALIMAAIVSLSPAFLSNSDTLGTTHESSPDKDGVMILGDIFQFDWMITRTVTVMWSISGWGKYRLPTEGDPPNAFLPVSRAVDVYLDNVSNPVFSYDPTHIPMTTTGGKIPISSLYHFNVEHNIESREQYYTPIDLYSFSAFAFVVERATNRSIPIIKFAVYGAGPGDFSASSRGIPARNRFAYDTGGGSATVEVESYAMFATVKHSNRARVLTFFMFTVNWILSLGSVITTSVMFNGHGVKDTVALLPITVILAIPAIRMLYVGSPPCGIFLDLVGFFPQMMLVVACTMVVLSGFAVRTIQGKSVTREKEEV
ncbi:hypothetical protein BDM02DRAFT_3269274 [Thelephora ganbajun]|uniref:Uncharacterized protein n=1 Tax=Thelephora ganbajun TaxID=370292 RepID=A0ACB6ZFU1_THEGA|nr:hypothetical protein BDM02DRAFT_3269274 [Thelephora ganbajun]